MNKEELNNLLSNIKNPTIGKALLTTYHKLNNCIISLEHSKHGDNVQ